MTSMMTGTQALDDQRTLHRDAVDEGVIDVGELFGTLWRGKWTIICAIIFLIFAGGYYAYRIAVPQFRSSAVVILETAQDQVVDLQSVVSGMSSDSSAVNSEVEVLRARGLMGKAVDRLDLTADPEFNPDLRDLTVFDAVKEQIKGLLGLQEAGFVLTPVEQQARTRDTVITLSLIHI